MAPKDPLQDFRLAEKAGDPVVLVNAALSAAHWLFYTQHDAAAALPIVLKAVATADKRKVPLTAALLNVGIDCADRLGKVAVQDRLLARGLDLPYDNSTAVALLWSRRGERLAHTGRLGAALEWYGKARDALRDLGDEHAHATILAKIADVLVARGELGEALRIRREEQLPAFERLGDERNRAVTLGQIADILVVRGELDEALSTYRELLPIFERLGDVRFHAVTLGKIADVLTARRKFDESLRMYADLLPVFERLGDVSERTITLGKIADVHLVLGNLTEALRILGEEQVPVFERLGNVRERAVALGKIAQIYAARGELDEALRLHLERLPIAREIHDIDSVAHIRFSCAKIRIERGDLKDGRAEVIRSELAEAFKIAMKLQRPNTVAPIGSLLGQVLAVTGHRKEATSVLEVAAAAFEKIGLVRDAAAVRRMMADL